MTEQELKEIESIIKEMPESWFFHEQANSLINTVKELKEENQQLETELMILR
ncbi:hypothetical protein NSS71_08435 [Niallia sp. FSL W8-0951]|uniref:hypothetical protein n=1 Tax=Niallia sp. FSL W8-0951 TaxID=2954639 RepID=UPI0030F4DB7A